MKNDKLFTTKDFYLSACLLASGLPLKQLQRREEKIVVFVFDDPKNIAKKIIQDHWSRKLIIPTRDLIEAINELKTRIYSGI